MINRVNRRLSAYVLGAICLAIGGVGGGCVRDDPAFRVSDMAAEPGLVGVWEGKDKDGGVIRFRIAEDVQAFGSGRLLARGSAGYDDAVAKKEVVPVYSVQAEFPPGAAAVDEQAAAGRAGEVKPTSLSVRWYVVSGGGEDALLCVQSEEKPGPGLGTLFTVPTQLVMGVRVQGDKLTVRTPKVMIMLSPATKLLDPPAVASPDAPCPAVEAALVKDASGKPPGGSFLTTDADRALGVLRQYGARAEFWQEPAMEFVRVK